MGESAKKVVDVHTIVQTINDEEALRQINNFVLDRLKRVRRAASDKIDWRVDMNVQMKQQHRSTKPWDKVGRIIKVNRVKLQIDFSPHPVYVVPKTMVQLAP